MTAVKNSIFDRNHCTFANAFLRKDISTHPNHSSDNNTNLSSCYTQNNLGSHSRRII